MTSPFHKLSFDEQRTLSPEQAIAYCDWIMSLPIKPFGKRKLTEEELLDRDYDMVGTRRRYEMGE